MWSIFEHVLDAEIWKARELRCISHKEKGPREFCVSQSEDAGAFLPVVDIKDVCETR